MGTPSALAADKLQVTFGFPFETITSRAERLEVMLRILKYLDVDKITIPDGGFPDAGVPPDAGMILPDGGVEPGPDAGVDGGPLPNVTLGLLPNDYGAAPKGCGCSAGGGLSSLLFLGLLLIFRARSAR